MSARGTTNRNDRGNTADRRRRKLWLLAHFGDGLAADCHHCGRRLFYSSLTVDRIVPGIDGGTYARGNIRPACLSCNAREGCRVRRWRPLVAT